MNHYFKNTEQNGQIHRFNDTICGLNFNFTTQDGVFSKEHVDHLSKLFLEVIIDDINPKNVLDFGCGYGVIGMVVSKYHSCSVDMIDVNTNAVELAKNNVKINSLQANVFESDMFSNVENKYSAILINPPIHAGKKICYNIYEDALNYLEENGNLYIVISKKHGAKTTIDFLSDIYKNVEVLYKKKGVYVIKTIK